MLNCWNGVLQKFCFQQIFFSLSFHPDQTRVDKRRLLHFFICVCHCVFFLFFNLYHTLVQICSHEHLCNHKERWREDKCVNDVAGYHCKAWKCVMNNKGLQKPQKKYIKKYFVLTPVHIIDWQYCHQTLHIGHYTFENCEVSDVHGTFTKNVPWSLSPLLDIIISFISFPFTPTSILIAFMSFALM